MDYLRSRTSKTARSEIASPGYIPKRRNDGDGDSVVQAVLGKLERRWTRALKHKSICSVDDLRELPSYTVEITTDNMEQTGRQSPRYFHCDSLKGDILEEYYVHRFKPGTLKPKKKPVVKDTDADDNSLYTLDFQHMGITEMKSEASPPLKKQKVKNDMAEDFAEILDRYIYSQYACNCCHVSTSDYGALGHTANGLGVKDYITRKTRNRLAASERRVLNSSNGLNLKDFVAWKKKKDKQEQIRRKRAERIAAFQPYFGEHHFQEILIGGKKIPRGKLDGKIQEEHIPEEMVEEEKCQESDCKNEPPDDDQSAYDDDSWASMSTYSSLTPVQLAVPDTILDTLMEHFAESRGEPFESFTDLIADEFCEATLPDSIAVSKITLDRDAIMKMKYR